MNDKKYKNHIESEYKRLFTNDQKDNQQFYHFIMFGSEGCEGYKVVQHESDISNDRINNMVLRARFNGHRNIGVYAFRSNVQIPIECITKNILEKDGVIKLY